MDSCSQEVSEYPHCATWIPRELRETWENLSPEEREAVQKRPPPLTDEDIEEIRLKHPLTEAHPLERVDKVKSRSPSTPESISSKLHIPRTRRRTETDPVTPCPKPRKTSLKSLFHIGSFKRDDSAAQSSGDDDSSSQQILTDATALLHQHLGTPSRPPLAIVIPNGQSLQNVQPRKKITPLSSSVNASEDHTPKAEYSHAEYQTPGHKYERMEYEASGPNYNLVEQGLIAPGTLDLTSPPTSKRPAFPRSSKFCGDLPLRNCQQDPSSRSEVNIRPKYKEPLRLFSDEPSLPKRNPRTPPRTFGSIFRRFDEEPVQNPSEWPSKSIGQRGLPTPICPTLEELNTICPPNSHLKPHPTTSPTMTQQDVGSITTGSDCKSYIGRKTALTLAWSGRIPGKPEMDVCLAYTRYLAHRMAEYENDRFSDLARVDVAFKWLRRYGGGDGLLFKTNQYPIPPKRGFGFFIAPLWMQETHRYDVLELIKTNACTLFNTNIHQNPDLVAHKTGLLQIMSSLRETLGIFQASLLLVGTNAELVLCRAANPSLNDRLSNIPNTRSTPRSNSIAAHIILSGTDDVQIFDVTKSLLTRHNAGVIAKFNVQFYAGVAVFVAGHPVAVIEMLDLKLRKTPLDRTVIQDARDRVQVILQGLFSAVRPPVEEDEIVPAPRHEEVNHLHSVSVDLSDTAAPESPKKTSPPASPRKLRSSKSMGNIKESFKKRFYGESPPPMPSPSTPSSPVPPVSFFEWSEDEDGKGKEKEKGKGRVKGRERGTGRGNTWPLVQGQAFT